MASTAQILDDLKYDNDYNIRVLEDWKEKFGKLFDGMIAKANRANNSYEELEDREREMNEEPERSDGSASTQVELLTNLLKESSMCMLDEINKLKEDAANHLESYHLTREVAREQYECRVSDIAKARDDIQLFVQIEDLLKEIEGHNIGEELPKAKIRQVRKRVTGAGAVKANAMSPFHQMREEAEEEKDEKIQEAWEEYVRHRKDLDKRVDDLESMRDSLYRHSGRR